MSDFDLNALIRDALDRWKEPDPHVIARRLVTKIPDDQLRAALGVTLPHHVREAERRRRSISADVSEALDEALSEIQDLKSGPNTTTTKPVGQSRWIRHARELTYRHHTGEKWVTMGAATAENCDAISSEYQRRADQNDFWARRFRRLAEALRATGVATVADLPPAMWSEGSEEEAA